MMARASTSEVKKDGEKMNGELTGLRRKLLGMRKEVSHRRRVASNDEFGRRRR